MPPALIPSGVAAIGLLLAGFSESATIKVQRVAEPITVDGALNEAAWSSASWADDFHQVEPVEFAPPGQSTRFALLFDDEHLYVGLIMDQSPDSIVARQLVQGRDVEGDDQVTLLIDPFGEEATGYAFTVNPNGVRAEAIIDDSDDFNEDWEDIWHAASQLDEGGWSVEMAIPFKTLSFPEGRDAWFINVLRTLSARNETIAWSSADRRVDLTTVREVRGFADAQSGTGLDIVASATLKHARDFEDGVSRTDFEPSLDLFYKLTPSLTAALTLNTDFSAAEVDNREVNLTRFDLFFPERRDFFLQDANVFEFGDIEENGLPFFSRRIGLSDEGDPLDLAGGVKLTGQHEGYRVGVIAVRQDIEDRRGEDTLGVARVQADVGETSAVGLLGTFGNPVTGASDSLLGVDYRYQNDEILEDQEIEAFAWWQQVDLEGVSANDQAYGASIAWPNDAIDAVFAFARIESDFAPPLGFVNRAGIRDYQLEAAYRFRPTDSWLRTVDVGFDFNWVEDDAGQLESRILEFTVLELGTQAGDFIEFGYARHYERLIEPFEIVEEIEVEPGRYHFDRGIIEWQSALQRSWTVSASLEWGDFFDGKLRAFEASASYAPSRHYAFGVDYEENRLDLASGKDTVRLIRLLGTVAFNARWSWTNLIQYDSESREAGLNSRLRWIPRSGQEGFIIVNHGFERDELDRFNSLESDIAVRFSYTFQF